MRKQVICTERGEVATVQITRSLRRRRDQVVYCSLLSAKGELETCRETCLKHRS